MALKCICLFTFLTTTAGLKNLTIMGLVGVTSESWPNTIGGDACVPAIEMGLEHVNSREDILPGYHLNMILKDTQCTIGVGLAAMFELLHAKPLKIMSIGPMCSVVSEVVAQTSPLWNITHLSPAGASPLLSNRKLYPRFFRIMSSYARTNLLKLELARQFDWKKIASITPAMGSFTAITDDLLRIVQGTDISILSQEIFDNDPTARVQSLKQKDARIILASTYGAETRQIMCVAIKEGLIGQKHVWIFQGWLFDTFWIIPPEEKINCTQDQLDTAAEGVLLTGSFMYNPNKEERGIANLTVSEFYQLFTQLENYNPEAVPFEFFSGNCYDAAWGVGLTLHCADQFLKDTGYPQSLDQFDYSDSYMADVITTCMTNLSFIGISGHMEFGYQGDPMKDQKLEQIQDGKRVLVGVYRTDREQPFIEWQNGGIRWKDNVVPRDSTLVTHVEAVIPIYLYSIMCCLAGIGILLAVSFLAFSILHRNHVHVKLSSPNINNVLLFGCILTYTYVFLVPLNEQSVTLCMRIRDFQLIGMVLVLVAGFMSILTIWYIIDSPVVVIRGLASEVYSAGNDAEIHMFIQVCTSRYSTYFSWTVYILEGVILAFGAFLAFETRKVKIEALNDSRLIGTCVYNVVVLSAVAVTLNFALEEKVALLYGMTSAILIIGTTTTQLIIFVPKVLAVFYPQLVTVQPFDAMNSSHRSFGLGSKSSHNSASTLPGVVGSTSTSSHQQQSTSDA